MNKSRSVLPAVIMLIVGVMIAVFIIIIIAIIGGQVQELTDEESRAADEFENFLEYLFRGYFPIIVVGFIVVIVVTLTTYDLKRRKKKEYEEELQSNLDYKPLQPSRRGKE